MALARLIPALGLPVFWALASETAVDIVGPEYAGRAIEKIGFGIVCATVFGIPVGTLISDMFGWRTAFAILAVVAVAKAQNTGKHRAGINRASAITQIFGASAATVLATPNMIRMLINSRLRGKRAQYAVRNGPKAATVNANKVTSSPAWDTLTFKSRAMDDEGTIYVVSEPNLFYVFKKP